MRRDWLQSHCCADRATETVSTALFNRVRYTYIWRRRNMHVILPLDHHVFVTWMYLDHIWCANLQTDLGFFHDRCCMHPFTHVYLPLEALQSDCQVSSLCHKGRRITGPCLRWGFRTVGPRSDWWLRQLVKWMPFWNYFCIGCWNWFACNLNWL